MSSKPFPPSKKKLQEGRRKGRLLKVPAVTQAGALIASLTACIYMVNFHLDKAQKLVEYCISDPLSNLNGCAGDGVRLAVYFLLVTLGAGALAGTLLEYMQVGKLFEPSLLKIDFSRLSPAGWLSKLPRSFLTTALRFMLTAMTLVLAVCWLVESDNLFRFQSIGFFFYSGAAVLAMIAGAEFLFAYKRYYSELGMTLEELKEEHRQSEGDPHIAALRKQKHRQILAADLEQQIKKAKVVIIN